MLTQRGDEAVRRVVGFPLGLNLAAPPRLQPETGGLQEGESPYMKNVLTRSGHIVPGRVITQDVWTFGETIRYAFIFKQDYVYWLITPGTTKCWVYNATAPVEKTPTPAFTNAPNIIWDGVQMINGFTPVCVITNRVDKPHYWAGGSGAFTILSNAYIARTIAGWQDRLFEGGVYDTSAWFANRIRWSKVGDITNYSDPSAGFMDLKDEGDPIERLRKIQSNMLLVLRRGSSYLGVPQNDYLNPVGFQRIHNFGIWAPATLQELVRGASWMFLSDDDIYRVDGTNFKDVGRKIRRELFRTVSATDLPYAWAWVDQREKEYYLVTKMADGTTRAWIYNFAEDTWTIQDLTGTQYIVTWVEQ